MSEQKKAIVFLADGTEEMEFTISAVDVLRRAKVDVTVVGVQLEKDYAVCSRGVKVLPDAKFEDINIDASQYDLVLIPGGAGGAKTLAAHEGIQKLIFDFYNKKKFVAFVCAGTLVAKAAGIPYKHKVTSYPGAVKEQLVSLYNYSDDRVVVDDNVITSRGPGTTFLFALTIVEQLVDAKTSEALREEMLTSADL
ncbi:Protein deglycase DJ-1zDJ-1 [Choanephora cucurbitarum]|uniref:D-lactate dehydratase n=1 Tax=Choanephora cucurbitarum TaxID=101091 RepID=A0A1C7MYU7_9FUNG|nr:Protein deglycase DJ-1zDJ-1 [Choanephora cucurbitarum]